MATRTFLALDLDEPIRRQLGNTQRELDRAGATVRWTKAAQLHVTVKFLGDVADEDLPQVCELAQQAAAEVEPFDFEVAAVTPGPPRGAMRMVWVDIADETGRMAQLNSRLESAYAEMGFRRENRRFHPHLTLGRIKAPRRLSELGRAVSAMSTRTFGTQSADNLIVYASQLTPQGPIYTPLAKAPLG